MTETLREGVLREWRGRYCHVTTYDENGSVPRGRVTIRPGNRWAWVDPDGCWGSTTGDYLDAETALIVAGER